MKKISCAQNNSLSYEVENVVPYLALLLFAFDKGAILLIDLFGAAALCQLPLLIPLENIVIFVFKHRHSKNLN